MPSFSKIKKLSQEKKLSHAINLWQNWKKKLGILAIDSLLTYKYTYTMCTCMPTVYEYMYFYMLAINELRLYTCICKYSLNSNFI